MIDEHISCGLNECVAHRYVMQLIEDTKELTKELARGQADLREVIAHLVESQGELRRVGDRLDYVIRELKEENLRRDAEIMKNRAFVDKAVGVIGSLSIISAVGSAILGLLHFISKGG